MDPLAFIVQCAIAIPVLIGMIAYALTRWDRTPLHLMVVAMMALVVPWLAAQVVRLVTGATASGVAALYVEHVSIMCTSPLFVLTMGHFARLRLLDFGRPVPTVVLCVPLVLVGLCVSDGLHHLYFANVDAAIAQSRPDAWGGPIYWATQIWNATLCLGGCVCLGIAVWRGRTPRERRGPLLVLAAVLAPIVAHFAYLAGLPSGDYSLAPLALGATGVLFVSGVEGFGVLSVQPVVRQDVLEHLRDAFLLVDPFGVVVDANPAAESILGRARPVLRGSTVGEVFSEVTGPAAAAALAERVAALGPGSEDEPCEIQALDGRVFEVASVSLRAEGSQPAGVFLTLRDRSQQLRNERRIRERQKLESVGILAAGVAHEVNNPLAFVRANLVHLQGLSDRIEKLVEERGEAGDELLEMPEILHESLEGIERIGRIVESMLRFSRVAGEGLRPVDVNDVVRESMRLADLHRDRSVAVESRLAADLPHVLGSADGLVQVMLNVLLNGKQALAGRTDGRIVVETAPDALGVVIQVHDNGPGIPESDLQRIFDPFFTTRPPDQGTGLGLSIAIDIVREHKGVLEVESEPGRGTCFAIRLPAETG